MEKQCTKCLVEKPLSDFYVTKRKNKEYRNPQCKACQNAYGRAHHAANREEFNARRKARQDARPDLWKAVNRKPKRRFGVLLNNARVRNIEVTIAFDDFVELISKPCFYCGSDLPTSGAGVDRINPQTGYVAGNVRSCCTNCNTAKLDMTEAEFGKWVCKVYTNWRPDVAA